MFRSMPPRPSPLAVPSADRLASRWTPERWSRAGVEPRVEDLLEDPMIHLVMRRDGIGTQEVMSAVGEARHRLANPAAVVADTDRVAARCLRNPAGPDLAMTGGQGLLSPCL
jgi:hypothetical protein